MTTLSTLLDQIDSGTVLLPEFQRGYVWNRDQVRGLMRSLYRGYPVGSLLVWETHADPGAVRGTGDVGPGVRRLLLDGQQRISSLYGVTRGAPPPFFDGNPTAFQNLRFNLAEESFEFYAPAKMKGDPLWIDVSELFVGGLEPHIQALSRDEAHAADLAGHMTRLSRLHALLQREFHEDVITGSDKTVDVVVDIFNRVNSGGTKLSKGDLALAKICADSPSARADMRMAVDTWSEAGFNFSLDWLLRNVNAVVTGKAPFSALDGVSPSAFADGLHQAKGYVGTTLNAISGRLGLDHDRVLMGRYAIPVISLLLTQNGGHFKDSAEKERALFWYVASGLWGRFTGSTETVLAVDYEAVSTGGVDELIAGLERWRGGNLSVSPHDFEGSSTGSRFYPLLYMLTRMCGARDFGTGDELRRGLLGNLSRLELHHIFPKARLRDAGYPRAQVNALANFAFLTQETNLEISKRLPQEYLPKYQAKHPGVLESQWVPTDPELWKIENYPEFLAQRRGLLTQAANDILESLRSGLAIPGQSELGPLLVSDAPADEDDVRSKAVSHLVDDLLAMGFSAPERDVEIADPADGRRVLAVAEALWPEGLQQGMGDPVVLELDPDGADLPALEGLGYEVFTTPESLREFAARRNAEASGDLASE